jgi:hypothetical protein
MDRQSLTHELRERARARYSQNISDNMVADFLEAKVMDAPPKAGRRRLWTAKELRRGLEIARIKSQGINNLGEIRWVLYLKDTDVPVLTDLFDDREILIRYFSRERNALTRTIHSAYPQVTNSDPSNWPAQTVIRNMGELDPVFHSFIQYRPDEMLEAYELLRHDSDDVTKLTGAFERLIRELVARLAPSLSSQEITDIVAVFDVSQLLQPMRGIFGPANDAEYSVATSIRNADRADFEAAKTLTAAVVWPFKKLGLPKVARSLLHPRWRLLVFVLLVHAVFLFRTKALQKAA